MLYQVYDVRISYDHGLSWEDLATEAAIFSWSPDTEPHPRQRQIFSLEPISFRIETTNTIDKNTIAQLLGYSPAQLERTPPPRWPRGARAAARQQRKRRAKQRQKRQRHA